MHKPVLLKETIESLSPRPNDNFIDCTAGQAGHSLAILEKTAPKGKLLAIDRDPEMLKQAEKIFSEKGLEKRVTLVCSSFSELKKAARENNFENAKGLLMDLGFSSWHTEESKRGFSFLKEEPLDMRYNPGKETLRAWDIVNGWPEKEIERILKEYGQERFAGRIARAVAEKRKLKKIESSLELAKVVKRAVPLKYCRARISPATRTFQALRIAVNKELQELALALPQSLEVCSEGARIAVISFHSLEDRIVKNFFRENKGLLEILTPKPICPSKREAAENPRARSAKLRAARIKK